MERQKQGAEPPDTRKTSGLPPPNIPHFEGLSPTSEEDKEAARARAMEYSGDLIQPPEPPEAKARAMENTEGLSQAPGKSEARAAGRGSGGPTAPGGSPVPAETPIDPGSMF